MSTGGILGHLWQLTSAIMTRHVISMDDKVPEMTVLLWLLPQLLWFVTYLHKGRKHQVQLGINEHKR